MRRRLETQQISATDHVVQSLKAELGENLTHLLSDEKEIVHYMLGLTGEPRAQLRVLRRDANRARIEVALAHHDAAFDDERRRRESEFIRAEHRGDDDVPPGLELTVGLHAHAAAQVVHYQCLLRLGEAELPGRARAHDR